MNLYLLSQNTNNGYDTFDCAVVCAETEEDAKMIHPGLDDWDGTDSSTWCSSSDVKARLIGVAIHGSQAGVVIASFNAG